MYVHRAALDPHTRYSFTFDQFCPKYCKIVGVMAQTLAKTSLDYKHVNLIR